MGRCLLYPKSLTILILAACMPTGAVGQQFDAPYYKLLEQNKQKFELNKTALTKNQLVVSSSLLKLAKAVY